MALLCGHTTVTLACRDEECPEFANEIDFAAHTFTGRTFFDDASESDLHCSGCGAFLGDDA